MRIIYQYLIYPTSIILLLLFFTSDVFASTDRSIGIRPIAPSGKTVTGDQYLLTIGIDSYATWPRLATAVNDAKAVRDVLLKRYHFDKAHLFELYNTDATRKGILSTLRTLAKKVKPEDSLVIFYAGHGHLDSITKAGSWIPVESGIDDSSAWITNQTIKDYLKADVIKAKHVLLVSDSCFAGDFFRGKRGKLPEVTDVVIKKAYQRASRQAITSGGVEPVSDAGFGGNSVFSHFFVSALQKNDSPFLIPSALFPEVKSGVAQNAEQFPQLGSLHGVGGQDGGEFVFFLKQVDRLHDLSGATKERQKEIDLLRQMEKEAERAKKKEQAEITKKEAELAAMDAKIAKMKAKLGTVNAGKNDSLQNMLAMVRQKTAQAKRLEELRKEREAEEKKRQEEIEQIKSEQRQKRIDTFEKELAVYNEIINSPYGEDMADAAWRSFAGNYLEENQIANFDMEMLKEMVFEGTTLQELQIRREELERRKELAFKIKMVEVKGGCFQMGDTFGVGYEDERPVHEVCVNDFQISMYEATQGQWETLTSSNPSKNKKGAIYPVESVSWDEVQSYIKRLNAVSGKDYRLPTEAEWEYACRSGGKSEKFCGGNEIDSLAWYNSSYTRPIGGKAPNGLGLYDMTGNVSEWVQDWYNYIEGGFMRKEMNYYKNSPRNDPQGPGTGLFRLARGGSVSNSSRNSRSAFRYASPPANRDRILGFRLALPSNQ